MFVVLEFQRSRFRKLMLKKAKKVRSQLCDILTLLKYFQYILKIRNLLINKELNKHKVFMFGE